MAKELLNRLNTLIQHLNQGILHGKEEPLRLCLIAMLTGGHVLIEDLPGLGKTTLALVLSASAGLSFGRVQCTSDLLPSDITGLSIFDRHENNFRFVPGPIFHNIVLLDEINRAMPRTQSAMLEAMEERRVTLEGTTHNLPDPFMVLATQNPSDQSGTYPLPESQLDRFMIRTGIGYPPEELEKRIIASGGIRDKIEGIVPMLGPHEITGLKHAVSQVFMSENLVTYIQRIVMASRRHSHILSGLSTRAAINLAQAGKASAFLDGRDYTAPEDISQVAIAVGAHRLVLRPEHDRNQRSELLAEIMSDIPYPLV